MDIYDIVNRYNEWCSNQFPKSTPISSSKGLQREAKELQEALEKPLSGEYYGEEEHDKLQKEVQMEYADCLMYLIDSARRYGYSIDDLFLFMDEKLQINLKRNWKINEDNSYSHIK